MPDITNQSHRTIFDNARMALSHLKKSIFEPMNSPLDRAILSLEFDPKQLSRTFPNKFDWLARGKVNFYLLAALAFELIVFNQFLPFVLFNVILVTYFLYRRQWMSDLFKAHIETIKNKAYLREASKALLLNNELEHSDIKLRLFNFIKQERDFNGYVLFQLLMDLNDAVENNQVEQETKLNQFFRIFEDIDVSVIKMQVPDKQHTQVFEQKSINKVDKDAQLTREKIEPVFQVPEHSPASSLAEINIVITNKNPLLDEISNDESLDANSQSEKTNEKPAEVETSKINEKEGSVESDSYDEKKETGHIANESGFRVIESAKPEQSEKPIEIIANISEKPEPRKEVVKTPLSESTRPKDIFDEDDAFENFDTVAGASVLAAAGVVAAADDDIGFDILDFDDDAGMPSLGDLNLDQDDFDDGYDIQEEDYLV